MNSQFKCKKNMNEMTTILTFNPRVNQDALVSAGLPFHQVGFFTELTKYHIPDLATFKVTTPS
jgi:hypothetical protein